MATLRKVYLENYNVTLGDTEVIISNVWKFRDFTIDLVFNSLTYPAADNDAEIKVQDSEDGATWNNTINALAKVEDGVMTAKVRVVDLHTRNIKLVFTQGSLSAGTIKGLYLTAGTESNN
tara:strand:- start:825 stop:1184 length:360 start_codon:yes stop_codon:yes gene_type:complete